MAAFIKISESLTWEGPSFLFYNMLEYVRAHTPEDEKLRPALGFGIEAALKYCDLSKLEPELKKRVHFVVKQYQAELPEIAKNWNRPEELTRAIEETERFIGLMNQEPF